VEKPKNHKLKEGSEEEVSLDFGPCCACEKEDPTVRNVLLLPRKAPVPGTGWGCAVCNLPPDGLVCVICDDCLKEKKQPRFAILDLATKKLRIPMEQISTEPFDHDIQAHKMWDLISQPAKGEG